MVYPAYRLCHGCRAQFTNRGSEINGVFYCEECSARRSSIRPVVTTSVPSHSVNTPNRAASISFLTPRNEKIIVVVFIAFIIMCFSISIKSNTKSDSNIVKTENKNEETVQDNISVINPKPERVKPSDAQIKQGIRDYINGNFSKAYPVLKEAAGYAGEGEACFYYAQMLRRGEYVSKNLNEAIKYLRKAQEAGYASAYNTLGVIYRDNFSGENYERQAFENFKNGTECSPPDLYAKINMAKCLSSGFGTRRDPEKAIELFKDAINDDCIMNYNGLAKSCVDELREDAFVGIINTIEKYYDYDSLYTLAQLLTYGIEQEENRAYVLFRYITSSIAYDTSYSIYDGMQAFQYKKGVCAAYAKLFEMMGKNVGVNVKYIGGYGLVNGAYKGHAWNVVYLRNGNKIHCDPCWATGGVTTDKRFIFDYNPTWWTTDENFFRQTHIPD